MNYAALVDAIQSYTQNYESDFVANIPTFVTQAETRIYNTVQIPALRKNVTGLTTNGNKYLSCPSDFLAVFSMAVIDGGGKALGGPGGNGGVSVNEFAYRPAQRDNAKRQGHHIQQQSLTPVACQDVGLDGGTQGDGFVGVEFGVRLAAEKLPNKAAYQRDSRRASHKSHFVDLIGGFLCVAKGDPTAIKASLDQRQDQLLKLLTAYGKGLAQRRPRTGGDFDHRPVRIG